MLVCYQKRIFMNYQFKPSRTPTLPFNIYFASYLSCTFKPLLTGFLKATSTERRQKRYTLLPEKITLQTVCLCHVAHRKRTISERKRLAISYVSIVYWKLRQNGSFAKGDDAKRAYFTMRTRVKPWTGSEENGIRGSCISYYLRQGMLVPVQIKRIEGERLYSSART